MADEANAAPAPAPTQPQTPTPPPGGPTSPPPPQTPPPNLAVSLSEEALKELAALRAEKAEREHAARVKAEQDRIEHEQRLIEKGKFEEALKSRDQAIAEARLTAENARKEKADFDSRVRRAEASKTLAVAFSGNTSLVDGVAEDLHKLWLDEFETVDGPDGAFVTRHKVTGQDPKAVIAERLATPRYAYAVKAGNRGGITPGGNVPAPTPQQGAAPTTQQRITQQLKDAISGGRGGAPGLAGNYGAPGLSGNYVGSN